MRVHNFVQSFKVGSIGEEHILQYLQESDTVEDIQDVRSDKAYQKIDVDFVITMTNGEVFKIEVKTDTYKSGNIYYETMSSVETDSIGCFEKTEADFLFYYFVNLQTLYVFSMPEYKEWFNLKEADFKAAGYQKHVKNRAGKDKQYTSIGYAFPYSLFDEEPLPWVRKLTVQLGGLI